MQLADSDELLEARRLANPALRARGLRVSRDVGLPVAALAAVIRGIERIGAEHGRRISTVAHAGDGNLHPTAEVGESAGEIAAAERVICWARVG